VKKQRALQERRTGMQISISISDVSLERWISTFK
jgi:hypothetical protein